MVPSRSVALVVIALFTLVLVTGSVRSATHYAGLLWSGPYDRDNDTVTLTPTSLLVSHRAVLTAYALADGAVQWSQPAPPVMAEVPSVTDGVVVAPDGFERYFVRPDLLLSRATRTIARDARTGAALWQSAGDPQDVTGRAVLLLDDTGREPELHAVGLHDGRTLWSRPAPGLASLVVVGDTVVTASADGRLTALRYADGSIERTENVPWAVSSRLSAAGGRLIVTSQGPSGQMNTVYHAESLNPLWQAGGALFDCGPVVCGTGARGLIGYDPDGATRWELAGMTVAWPVGADRIVASSDLDGRFQLLDPATGRTVGAPGTGIGSWHPDGHSTVSEVPASSSVYVLRDDTTILRIDLRTGGQYVAGTLAGAGWTGCRNAGRYLVCLRESHLTVTAVA
jgi:outer membrane protein assembly factor BamB